MAKTKRLMPRASSSADQVAKQLAASLTKAQEIQLDNAIVLAGEQRLGRSIDKQDIENIAKRTSDPNVATRLFAQFSKTQEKSSYEVIMRLSIGVAQVYCEQAGMFNKELGKTEIVPQTLAAFFVSRICSAVDDNIRQIVEVDAAPSLKLVYMFDSFWSTLDIEKLKDIMFPVGKSESSTPVSFRKIKLDGVNAYSIHHNGKHCGHLFWDEELENPNDDSNGWRSTLFDGFHSSRFIEGPLKNPNDPYMAVAKNGDLKLHNPQRLSLADAKRWARGALR